MDGHPRILLVDDEPAIRNVVAALLAKEWPGAAILPVVDAASRDEALEAGGFDLVITDYQLGWSNGLAVLQGVKARYPDCPVIMFTGTGNEEVAVEAMKAGLYDYVLKPKHVLRLPASVRGALSRIEQRKTAKAVEGRTRTLADALDTSVVGLFVLDADFHVVWMNAALERYFGLRREDVIGQDKRRLIQERIKSLFEDAEGFAERVLGSYEENKHLSGFECHILGGDGRDERWVEHRSFPILTGPYAGGRVEHYYDVTEHKRARESLQDYKREQHLLFKTLPVAVYRARLTGDYGATWVSDSVVGLTGFAPECFTGDSAFWLARVHPEDREQVLRSAAAGISHGGYTHEYRWRCADETYHWFMDRAVVVTGANGRPRELVGIWLDRSAQKRSEEQTNFLKALVEQSADPLYCIDPAQGFKLIYVNPATCRQFGYTEEQLLTMRVPDWDPNFSPEACEAFWAKLKSQTTIQFETLYHHPDGRTIPVEVTNAFVQVGGHEYAVGNFRNIAERRQAEEALRRSEEYFRALIEHSSDMISVLAPDSTIRYESPSVERTLGHAPAEQVGKKALDFVHPDDLPKVLTAFAQGIQNPGSIHTHEVRFQDRDGRWHMLECTGKFFIGSSGAAAVVINSRDITRRKRSEAGRDLMHRLSERLLQGETPDQFLPLVCRQLGELFEAPLVWIGRQEPDGRLEVQASAGAEGIDPARYWPQIRADLDDPSGGTHPAGAVLRTGRTQLVRIGAPPTRGWEAFAHDCRLATALAIPIQTPDRLSSLLCLYHPRSDFFDGEMVEQLEQIASQIGIALVTAADQSRLRLQEAAMATAANAIFITDREGRIQWANQALTRLSGYTAAEAVGQTPRLLKSGKHGLAFFQELWQTILAGQPWRSEVVCRHKDGHLYTVDQTITPLKNGRGEVTHFVAIHEDITAQKEAEARILHMAQHDALTDLPNRMLLRDRLSQTLPRAKRNGRLVALLFLDLDRFKLINDTLGHELGDQLLKDVADRLRQCVRESDTVARHGGDEFTVVLADLQDAKGAVRVAENILAALSEPFNLEGRQVYTAASIGIVLYPADANDVDGLLTHADTAMYRAKQQGGNGYQFFTPAMQTQVRARLETEHTLRDALARREFVLHYQPVVDLATGAVTGFEALVRWRSPSAGLVPPVEFIPIAEETGLIIPLGDWVLREACTRIKAWQQAGFPSLRMAVNLSARQFRQPRLADKVAGTLKETGLEARDLELEITESVFLADVKATLETLTALKALGVRLAIDDFGTGFSSLNYLKRVPVDRLKIDQSFVGGLGADPDDEAIVTAIIALARTLKLAVVAEGVQEESHRTFLLSQGCPEAQGFLFSRPLPPEEVPVFLKEVAGR